MQFVMFCTPGSCQKILWFPRLNGKSLNVSLPSSFSFVFEEKVDPRPWPLFLLGLKACQTYVIQEIPLLGPSGVTIATGTRTCHCWPAPYSLLCTCSLACFLFFSLPLYCLKPFVMVGGISQVLLMLSWGHSM